MEVQLYLLVRYFLLKAMMAGDDEARKKKYPGVFSPDITSDYKVASEEFFLSTLIKKCKYCAYNVTRAFLLTNAD